MGLLSRLISIVLLSTVFAAAQSSDKPAASLPFQLKQIGPNVWSAIDDAKGNAGANAGFVIGR